MELRCLPLPLLLHALGDGVPIQHHLTVSTNTGTVAVGLGNGAGSFTAQTSVTVSTTPSGVAVADLNHDAVLDVVTANYGIGAGNNGLSILLGVPTPVVTSISPATSVAGTAVTITGTGFLSSSTGPHPSLSRAAAVTWCGSATNRSRRAGGTKASFCSAPRCPSSRCGASPPRTTPFAFQTVSLNA